MKRVIGICLLLMTASFVYGNTPVFDFTNFMQAIENGATMIEQLQATYEQIKSSKEMVEQQVKMLQEGTLQVDWDNPQSIARSLMTYGNRQMNYLNGIENILNSKSLKWGKNSYSLSDVFTTDFLGPEGTFATGFDDPFERELSTEEKASFWSKYGMSFGNYMRINAMKETTIKAVTESVAYVEYLKGNLQKDAEELDELAQTDAKSASLVAQLQKANALTIKNVQELSSIKGVMTNILAILANEAYQKQLAENVEERAGILLGQATEGVGYTDENLNYLFANEDGVEGVLTDQFDWDPEKGIIHNIINNEDE